MAQTTNYQLHQWKPYEPVRRAELNDSMNKLDTALSAKADSAELEPQLTAITQTLAALEERPDVVFGTYSGNGNYSQSIALGFAPKAVLVICRNGAFSNYSGLALPEASALTSANGGLIYTDGNGFYAKYSTPNAMANEPGHAYNYIAFK